MVIKKISIIIPVYNPTIDELDKCINSLINQTYKNLEIIIVDDGSIKKIANLCDYYCRDERVKVIHKENGGISSARNCGLEIATGDYIGFVDNDDYVKSNMYKKLIDDMDDETDIAICSYISIDKRSEELQNNSKYEMVESGIIKGLDALKEMHLNAKQRLNYEFVWNKIYKRELFNNIKFPEGMYSEDYCINYLSYIKARKIKKISDILYIHTKNNNTASIINNRKMRIDNVKHYINESILLFEKKEFELSRIASESAFELITKLGIMNFKELMLLYKARNQTLKFIKMRSTRENIKLILPILYSIYKSNY